MKRNLLFEVDIKVPYINFSSTVLRTESWTRKTFRAAHPRWVYCSDISDLCPQPEQIMVLNESSFVNIGLGIYYLFAGTVFILWYVPVIIALCDEKFAKSSCYRLLTIISFVGFVDNMLWKIVFLENCVFWKNECYEKFQMDVYCLMFNAIISGFLSLIGVPFCGSSQTFMRVIGAMAFCKFSPCFFRSKAWILS